MRRLDNKSVGQVQKAVMSFEDGTHANGLNLEKLYHCDFFSLRASKDLRIILCPFDKEEKNHWLLAYVDHHDKAYEWADHKRLIYTQATQTFDIIIVHGKELSVMEEVPIIKGPFSNWTNEYFCAIGIPLPLTNSIKTISHQDQINELEGFIPSLTFEALQFAFWGESPEAVIEFVEAGKLDQQTYSTAETLSSPNNLSNFIQLHRADELEKFYQGKFSDWMIYLHPTQRILAERNFEGPVKVTGGAGTGKTVVALHRAKFLQAHRRDERPVFFTTFNRNLAENLEEKFKCLDLKSHIVILKNIHSWLLDYAKKYNFISSNTTILDFDRELHEKVWKQIISKYPDKGFPIEFLMDEWEKVIMYHDIISLEDYLAVSRVGRQHALRSEERRNVWQLITAYVFHLKEKQYLHLNHLCNRITRYLHNHPSLRPFSHIIVDEVQDFGLPELRLIRQLTDKGTNDLFLCGDPMQKIYPKPFLLSHADIHIKGQRSKKLMINYRTTEQIRQQAVQVIEEVSFKDFEGQAISPKGYYSLFTGEKPEYRTFDHYKSEIGFITTKINTLIQSEIIQASEICVGTFLNQSIKNVMKAFYKDKISFYDLRNHQGSKNGVRLSSFHKMKGMEFRVVFLLGLSKDNLPYKFRAFDLMSPLKQQAEINTQKCLLYVAMSRARDMLYLTGVGEKSDWIDI